MSNSKCFQKRKIRNSRGSSSMYQYLETVIVNQFCKAVDPEIRQVQRRNCNAVGQSVMKMRD